MHITFIIAFTDSQILTFYCKQSEMGFTFVYKYLICNNSTFYFLNNIIILRFGFSMLENDALILNHTPKYQLISKENIKEYAFER